MGISHSEERRTLEDHQSGRTAKCIWRAGPANENEEAYDTGGLGGEGADHGRYPGTGRHKPHRKWERMVQDYELRALAEVLGVTSDWLMDEEEK